MKKTPLFLALSLCLLTACKKSNSSSSSNYHLTANIDGTPQTFNFSPMAFELQNAGQTVITIEGFTSSSATSAMSIAWTNNGANATFGVGTFSDTSLNYSTDGSYTNGTTGYVAGSGIALLAEVSNVAIKNHLLFTITAVDSTSVKGTFSGDFYDDDDVSGSIKTITNGDFDVPWKK